MTWLNSLDESIICSYPCFLQSSSTLRGCHWRRPWPKQRKPNGDVHFLRRILCGFSFLFCQHLCCSHHNHIPGAGWQNDGGVQLGEKRGEYTFIYNECMQYAVSKKPNIWPQYPVDWIMNQALYIYIYIFHVARFY